MSNLTVLAKPEKHKSELEKFRIFYEYTRVDRKKVLHRLAAHGSSESNR